MASRLPLSLERQLQSERWNAPRRRFDQWKALGWKLALWRLLWLPYALGGEVPTPWLPERRSHRGAPPSSAARETVKAVDAIRRRVWLNMTLACIARGIWLPFVGGIAIASVQLIRDRDWSPQYLVWFWAVTIPLGMVLALLQRPGRWRTAWMLDHTFQLRDRMTTAIEAIDQPAPEIKNGAPMNYLQLADAANVAIGLRADPRFRIHPPAREVSLAILTGLLLMSLLFLRGVGGSVAELVDPSVPEFVPAAERRTAAGTTDSPADPSERPPSVAEVQAQADKSQTTKDDLNEVADALDQNALTQPAADAIRDGDYATAAQSLRDVAQQADEMSPQARSDLADALDDAAAATDETSPSLSNSAANAAGGLREGGDAAEDGLRDLGDAVDLAGDSVVPQEQLASDMAEAQQNESNQSQGADASSAASDSAQPGQPSSSTGAQSSNPSDPTGADAAPGQASDAQQSQSSDSSSDSGSESDSQGQQESGSESASSQGDGMQPGQANGGQSESGGQAESGEAQGQGTGNEENAENSQAQANGESQNNASTSSEQAGGSAGGESQAEGEATKQPGSTGAGEPGENTDAPPTVTSVSAEPTASAPGAQPTVAPNSSVSLDGDGGESIQLGGGSSASSLGSGAGVMVAGGEATQEPVPTAAPDNNRVPEDYRQIVEQYFSRDGT